MAPLSYAILVSSDRREVKHAVAAAHGAEVRALAREFSAVLSGAPGPEEQHYVQSYESLGWDLLREASTTVDPSVARTTVASQAAAIVLQNAAIEAPLSRSARTQDSPRAGVALHVVDTVRRIVGRELLPPDDADQLDAHTDIGTQDLVARLTLQLAQLRTADARERSEGAELANIDRVAATLHLSNVEMGRLFGITRQALDGWRTKGIPSAHHDRLAAVASLCDLLERKLRADRIAGVARRPATAYGGISMLDMIESGRHAELLELVRASFAWHEGS